MNRGESMTREEKFLKCWQSPYLFAKNFIKIVDKKGNLVDFSFNPVQKNFVENMDRYNIILKSRQMGMSVSICAISIHMAITKPNSTILLLSHTDESTRAIFSKLKQMYNSVPKQLKPKLKTNNRNALEMLNGSSITCCTMSRKDKGRGNSCDLVHLSEFAFVDSEVAQNQLLSLEQTLKDNGRLIIETTANGMNFFSEHYFKAKSHENAYKCFFYNYVDGACMFLDQYETAMKTFENINGHRFCHEDLTEEERELLGFEGMTLEILCWRRMKITNSSLNQFNQEYPLTDELAFVSTGSNVFDKGCIAKNKMRVKSVKPLPKPQLNTLLQPYYGKDLLMYDLPKRDRRYVISVDCSEGIGKDYHVALVIDCESMQQVAIFRNNKLRPSQFADIVNALGRMYNNAYCIVELASAGHTVIERLYYQLQYYNMHRHETYDQFNKKVFKLGWQTTGQSKGMAIATLREVFETDGVLINSEVILDEMSTYGFENGKYNAMSGMHDDTVMAFAIAMEVMKKPIKWKQM